MLQRHRFDRAHMILGPVWHDLFFTGDQRHLTRAAQGTDAVIDLARQQTQWQADDARATRQHAFDRIMGLARICRAQDSGDRALILGYSGCEKYRFNQASLERRHPQFSRGGREYRLARLCAPAPILRARVRQPRATGARPLLRRRAGWDGSPALCGTRASRPPCRLGAPE